MSREEKPYDRREKQSEEKQNFYIFFWLAANEGWRRVWTQKKTQMQFLFLYCPFFLNHPTKKVFKLKQEFCYYIFSLLSTYKQLRDIEKLIE